MLALGAPQRGRGPAHWGEPDGPLVDQRDEDDAVGSAVDPMARVDDVLVGARLRDALTTGTLQVHYQPIVTLPSSRVVGCEALVRWPEARHAPGALRRAGEPEAELVPPDAMVAVAARADLIDDLGRYVLERACEQAQRCTSVDGSGPSVSVNVSADQLSDGRLPEHVSAVLAKTGLAPGRLCLEITESQALTDLKSARRQLTAIRALDVRLALDDFGTGYSSLSLMRDLPFDVVKIDRSFVERVDREPAEAVLVRMIIEAAHSLGQRTCAEGVATHAQARQLVSMGCDLGQGWLFGRPTPPGPDLDALLLGREPIVEGLSSGQPPPLSLGARAEAVVLAEPDLRVTYASAGAIEVLGVSPQELTGRNLDEVVEGDLLAPGRRDLRVREPGGAARWVRATTQRLPGPTGDGDGPLVWVAHDITENVRTQQALRKSEGLFRQVFDDAPIGMALYDQDGRFLRVNRAFAGYLGRGGGELLWLRHQDVTHPDDRAADEVSIADLYSGESRWYQTRKRFLHVDGHAVWADVRASLVEGDVDARYVLSHVVPAEPQ
jgi:PAS domain S-box-containing protein